MRSAAWVPVDADVDLARELLRTFWDQRAAEAFRFGVRVSHASAGCASRLLSCCRRYSEPRPDPGAVPACDDTTGGGSGSELEPSSDMCAAYAISVWTG